MFEQPQESEATVAERNWPVPHTPLASQITKSFEWIGPRISYSSCVHATAHVREIDPCILDIVVFVNSIRRTLASCCPNPNPSFVVLIHPPHLAGKGITADNHLMPRILSCKTYSRRLAYANRCVSSDAPRVNIWGVRHTRSKGLPLPTVPPCGVTVPPWVSVSQAPRVGLASAMA